MLGQFTRNYTQTTKRGLLTTNGAMLPARGIAPVCCGGITSVVKDRKVSGDEKSRTRDGDDAAISA